MRRGPSYAGIKRNESRSISAHIVLWSFSAYSGGRVIMHIYMEDFVMEMQNNKMEVREAVTPEAGDKLPTEACTDILRWSATCPLSHNISEHELFSRL